MQDPMTFCERLQERQARARHGNGAAVWIQRLRGLALSALLGIAAVAPAAAEGLALSGFGSLGWAKSDRPYAYLRYVDENGTWSRDSRLGLQADWQLPEAWSATLQGLLSPSLRKDSAWDLSSTWAFVGWRPNNEWLLRAGKLRIPLYMHSEVLDVAHALPLARLPVEVYSISPSDAFYGVYLSHSRPWRAGDVSVEGIFGRATTTARQWLTDGVAPFVPSGPLFTKVKADVVGLVGTYAEPRLTVRAAGFVAHTRSGDGTALPVRPVYQATGPGQGFYLTPPSTLAPTTDFIRNSFLIVGADWRLADGWRISAEALRNWQGRTEVGSDNVAGYVAVAKTIGSMTPYVAVSALNTGRAQRDTWRRLTAPTLPATALGASFLLASQRAFAESTIYMAQQSTVALGSTWAIDSNQSLKFEWARTHIGEASRLVDAAPGQRVQRTRVHVLSIIYGFSF
jgi:hypothetical protein